MLALDAESVEVFFDQVACGTILADFDFGTFLLWLHRLDTHLGGATREHDQSRIHACPTSTLSVVRPLTTRSYS